MTHMKALLWQSAVKTNKPTRNLTENWCSHRKDHESQCFLELTVWYGYSSTMKMTSTGFSKMVVLYQITWYQITEDNNLNFFLKYPVATWEFIKCENMKLRFHCRFHATLTVETKEATNDKKGTKATNCSVKSTASKNTKCSINERLKITSF